MSTDSGPTARLDPEADAESRVSPLELFLDLVFVLSFTQVTYLLGHIGFRYRKVHTWNVQRSVATFLMLALIPLALEADAVVSLALVSAVLIGLIAYESIHFRDARARVRANPGATLAEMRGRPL